MKKIKFFWNMTPCLLVVKSRFSLSDVAMYGNIALIFRTAYGCTDGKFEHQETI